MVAENTSADKYTREAPGGNSGRSTSLERAFFMREDHTIVAQPPAIPKTVDLRLTDYLYDTLSPTDAAAFLLGEPFPQLRDMGYWLHPGNKALLRQARQDPQLWKAVGLASELADLGQDKLETWLDALAQLDGSCCLESAVLP